MTEPTKPEGTYRCAERGTSSPLADKTWRATGERRPPAAGEWFIHIAGRYSEARRTHVDLDADQWIAEEVT